MPVNSIKILLVILYLTIWGFNSAHPKTFKIDGVYLVVNNQMLTRSEALEYLKTFENKIEQSPYTFEEKTKKIKELNNSLLKSLVQELLLLDRADALGLEPTEKEIEDRLDQIAEKQPEIFEAFRENELQEQLIKDFKKQRVIAHEIESRIRTDEKELKEHCLAELKGQRKIGLSQILFRGDEEDAQKKAIEVKKAFKAGTDFGRLAEKFSEDPSVTKTKGRLGYFSQGELLQVINDAAFLLNPGEMSPIISSEFGFHLLHVFDEEVPEGINCEKLTPSQNNQYANVVYGKKRDRLLQDYLQELWACARIEVKNPFDSGLPHEKNLPKMKVTNKSCRVRLGAIRERAIEKAKNTSKK